MADLTQVEADQVQSANQSDRRVVVFVHGLWLLPSSWDRWRTRFEAAGYSTMAPGWPDDPNTVDEANRHPEVMAHKTIGQIADHFEYVIGRLDTKPAIVGHSFGGLLTQILAGRGVSSASVAIDPAPFRGVLPLPISALKSAAPVIGNPANHGRAVPLTYDQFRYAFANAVSEDEAKELYATYAVPGSGVPLFQAATANLNPWTEAKVEHEGPRPRAAPHHRRREGPHGALGHRQCLLQEAEAQSRGDRDREDTRPGPLADHRSRLERRGRDRPGLHPTLRLTSPAARRVPGQRLRASPVNRRRWRPHRGVGRSARPRP